MNSEEPTASTDGVVRTQDGHPLLTNRSLWIQFPTVKNRTWRHGNIVIAGDAAHTAHFSIGSGTKLAMEDSIALARTLQSTADVKAAREPAAERRLEHRLDGGKGVDQVW